MPVQGEEDRPLHPKRPRRWVSQKAEPPGEVECAGETTVRAEEK